MNRLLLFWVQLLVQQGSGHTLASCVTCHLLRVTVVLVPALSVSNEVAAAGDEVTSLRRSGNILTYSLNFKKGTK